MIPCTMQVSWDSEHIRIRSINRISKHVNNFKRHRIRHKSITLTTNAPPFKLFAVFVDVMARNGPSTDEHFYF